MKVVFSVDVTREQEMRKSDCRNAVWRSCRLGFQAAGSAVAAEIVLKAAHSTSVSEPYHLGLEYMKKKLEEYTNGRATLEFSPTISWGTNRR